MAVLREIPQVTTLKEIKEKITTKEFDVIYMAQMYRKNENRKKGIRATYTHLISQKQNQQRNL